MVASQLALPLPEPVPTLLRLWTPEEIYNRLDSGNMEHFVEDRRIEHKGPNVNARLLAEYLSMWANTQPHGGLIFVGIEDGGRVIGCKSMAASHQNNIESLSHLCADARFFTKNIATKNSSGEDDYILVYRVPYRSDRVVETSSGDAFIREGDRKVRLTDAVKRELQISKGEVHYELERTPLKFPVDFDLAEINKFCRALHSSRRLRSEKSCEELLELAKLGRREGKTFYPNLACALLFAKDPRDVVPGARIRLIRYDGMEERFGAELNRVYSTFIDGNIAHLLFEAKQIISAQLRSFQHYDDTGRLRIQQEYPEEAWFEAVVNAVAHRSYNLKTQNIFVKIFDDKIVVESPGGFVPPTTPITIYDAHNPRNPILMEAMMHLELTFCGFEGTRRMRRAMEVAKLPSPRFTSVNISSHQVHVQLDNNIIARRAAQSDKPFAGLPSDVFMGLSVDERAVLNFLTNQRSINITVAALVIDKSWPTAQKAVASLVERGVLIETNDRRKRHDATKTYSLKQQTPA